MDLHTVTAHVGVDEAGPWRPGDVWLAGGTWLFSEPQPAARRLVDLTDAGWEPLIDRPDGALEIAATCTVERLAHHPHPLFEACTRAFLSSFKVQGAATVGGNLCAALPAAPMISLTAALDGTCLLLAPDGSTRTVGVTQFVTGAGTTALRPGELLRSITLPAEALARRSAMRQASLYALGRSAALVIGTRGPAGELAVTVTASTVRPFRLSFPGPPGAAELADAVGGVEWFVDVHGDGDWRRHMTLRMAQEIRDELA